MRCLTIVLLVVCYTTASHYYSPTGRRDALSDPVQPRDVLPVPQYASGTVNGASAIFELNTFARPMTVHNTPNILNVSIIAFYVIIQSDSAPFTFRSLQFGLYQNNDTDSSPAGSILTIVASENTTQWTTGPVIYENFLYTVVDQGQFVVNMGYNIFPLPSPLQVKPDDVFWVAMYVPSGEPTFPLCSTTSTSFPLHDVYFQANVTGLPAVAVVGTGASDFKKLSGSFNLGIGVILQYFLDIPIVGPEALSVYDQASPNPVPILVPDPRNPDGTFAFSIANPGRIVDSACSIEKGARLLGSLVTLLLLLL